jgi:hypothetical protein
MSTERRADAVKSDIYLQAGLIFDELRALELAAADMYRRFAASFPADRIFWQNLAEDEDGHAVLIEELKTVLLKNGAPFEIIWPSLPALAAFRQGVEQQSLRLQHGVIGRRAALFIARDLERTLIERSVYGAVRSGKPEFRMVQEKIRRETSGHLERLQNYILTIFP